VLTEVMNWKQRRRPHRHQPQSGRVYRLQKRPLRHLDRAPPGLRRHRAGGRTPGPGPENREVQKPQGTPPHPDPGALPPGLGPRPQSRGGDRPAGGQNRRLAPQGIRGRPGGAHQNPPPPPAGGGVSETPGPLRPPLQAGAERRPPPGNSRQGGRLLGRGGLIIRVSDQLSCGEISLFEKDPEAAKAAKARLEAKRKQRRERYAKNKDQINSKGRERRAKDKDRINAHQREMRPKNSDQINALARAHYAQKKENH
jgi:hypothetical protein